MFARAIDAPPAPEADCDAASALRRRIEALAAACPEIEQACLAAGERLGETIPALSEFAPLLEGLLATLSGEACAAASEDIDSLASELARAAEELSEEGRRLGQLAERNRAIGKRIEDLLAFTRTMSWLVFTLKIESAPLTRLSADMTAFAENIHRLAETTRQALDNYHATHSRLEAVLQAAQAAQARFQTEHQAQLAGLADELREVLTEANARRLAAGASLQRNSGRARAMIGRIGEAVAALQIGDRTRQRLEHAHLALALIAEALDGRAPAVLGGLDGAELETLAARASRLQARQIESARKEYVSQAESILATLGSLIEENEFSGREGGVGAEGSFLAALEGRLIAAREAIAHFRGARAAVDEAAHSVVAIVEDMRKRTAALTDHIVDVTIIGTNALLRSMRLGDQGKGVALIARELRAYGEQTGAIIRTLPAALDGVVEIAAGFSKGGRLDAAKVASLQARMSAAAEVFGAGHRAMEIACARLAGAAKENRERLVEASDRLGASAEACSSLSATEESLAAAAQALAGSRRPDLDPVLDALLLPVYTMDAEREIHAEFFGGGKARPAPSRRKRRNEPDLAEAILL